MQLVRVHMCKLTLARKKQEREAQNCTRDVFEDEESDDSSDSDSDVIMVESSSTPPLVAIARLLLPHQSPESWAQRLLESKANHWRRGWRS